ncbi:MAG: outer membrane protein assembly factor BamC [Methylobacter sp.]|nr:outer membrane protein assembly factor BamC [Methylobacter sp.]
MMGFGYRLYPSYRTFHYPLIMKTKIRSLIIVAVLVNVSACSTIKNLFPDKEKDYQFTTEIPPLTIPPDLAGDSIANAPAAPAAETADVAPAVPSTDKFAGSEFEQPSAGPKGEIQGGISYTAPTVDRKLIQVELVDADQGTKRLRIGAPSAIAWRMVGKALSRKSVEVTNRNQEEGLFHVQYDPDKKEVEDGSIWGEVVFLFKGFEIAEQEYVLKLVENNRQTDVIIMDNEQNPVADATSLSLLTLLHDTIKSDLAK